MTAEVLQTIAELVAAGTERKRSYLTGWPRLIALNSKFVGLNPARLVLESCEGINPVGCKLVHTIRFQQHSILIDSIAG
jgi:hypothetical protein